MSMSGKSRMMKLKASARKTSSAILDDTASIVNTRLNSMMGNVVEQPRGWQKVQRKLGQAIEYGRAEGILKPPDSSHLQRKDSVIDLPTVDDIEPIKNIEPPSQKVNIPTNDLTLIHEAIPFLPVCLAVFCCILNVFFPGSGTFICGWFGLCFGQPRVNIKEGQKMWTVVINMMVGVAQFFTITFFLVGWFWSIAWGGLLFIHSITYRDALEQKQKEEIATAAIEALTKGSILHRRGVKGLVKAHKTSKEKKEQKSKSRFTLFSKKSKK